MERWQETKEKETQWLRCGSQGTDRTWVDRLWQLQLIWSSLNVSLEKTQHSFLLVLFNYKNTAFTRDIRVMLQTDASLAFKKVIFGWESALTRQCGLFFHKSATTLKNRFIIKIIIRSPNKHWDRFCADGKWAAFIKRSFFFLVKAFYNTCQYSSIHTQFGVQGHFDMQTRFSKRQSSD